MTLEQMIASGALAALWIVVLVMAGEMRRRQRTDRVTLERLTHLQERIAGVDSLVFDLDRKVARAAKAASNAETNAADARAGAVAAIRQACEAETKVDALTPKRTAIKITPETVGLYDAAPGNLIHYGGGPAKPAVIGTEDAALIAGCSARTVNNAIYAGKLPAEKVGGKWKIAYHDALAWARERQA